MEGWGWEGWERRSASGDTRIPHNKQCTQWQQTIAGVEVRWLIRTAIYSQQPDPSTTYWTDSMKPIPSENNFPDSLSPSTQIFSFFLLIDMDVFMSMKACAWRQKIWKLGQSREVCDSLCNHAGYRHGSNHRCHMSVARLWAEGGDTQYTPQTHDTSLVSIHG